MFTLKLDEFRSIPSSQKRRKLGNKRGASHVQGEEMNALETGKAEKEKRWALEEEVKTQKMMIEMLVRERKEAAGRTQGSAGMEMEKLMQLQGRVMEAVEVITTKAAARSLSSHSQLESLYNHRIQTARQPLEKEILELKSQLLEREQELAQLCTLMTELKTELVRCNENLVISQQELKAVKFKNSSLELAKSMLHKQIIDLKRSNSQLRTDNSQLSTRSISPLANTRKTSTPIRDFSDRNDHISNAISHLQHLVNTEKRNLRAVKSALARELKVKTMVEAGLNEALIEIKAEIEKNKGNRVEILEKQRKMIEGLIEKSAGIENYYTRP